MFVGWIYFFLSNLLRLRWKLEIYRYRNKLYLCTVDILLRCATTRYLAVLKINMAVTCLHLMSRRVCCLCLSEDPLRRWRMTIVHYLNQPGCRRLCWSFADASLECILNWLQCTIMCLECTLVTSSIIVYSCSVLFFSRPRSEGWPHHGRTFSIYPCHLSFWLTFPRRVLSTSWCCPPRPCVVFLACVHLALFLALFLSPGNSIVSSWCDHSMLASLLWQCLTSALHTP